MGLQGLCEGLQGLVALSLSESESPGAKSSASSSSLAPASLSVVMVEGLSSGLKTGKEDTTKRAIRNHGESMMMTIEHGLDLSLARLAVT